MLSRRRFVLTSVGTVLAGAPAIAGRRQLTAQQVLDRIRAGIGVPWRDTSVDGFKAGDPATAVTGIATTAMATLDVLRKAAAARRNLIVTHEPVFFSANDAPGNRAADPVYLAKKALIDERGLVVLRLTDHWNARVPNEPARALAAALDWGKGQAGADGVYKIAPTTLSAIRALAERRLSARGIRTVGRPDLTVSTVLVSPGTTDLLTTVKHLPSVDLVLAGEPREWEAVPYVLDAAAAGQAKGLIALGRVVSEEPGARACADWLKTIVPGVPVEATAVGDPYWSPR